MSGSIGEESDYIKLLLNTSKLQGHALLDTATTSQIKTISQIARNLLKIPLDESVKEIINQKEKLFLKLGNLKSNVRQKGKLISKHRKFLLSMFLAVGPILLNIIEHFKSQGISETLPADPKQGTENKNNENVN